MLRQLNGNRNGRTRRRRSSIRDAAAPVVEMMEPRKMFSVSVNDWGQLNIYPDNPGNINVWTDGLFVHTIVDGTQDVFAVPIVKSIHIGAMWTSNISIGSNLPTGWSRRIRSTATAGTITCAAERTRTRSTAAGNETLDGGTGADFWQDSMSGGAGNDTASAESGFDLVDIIENFVGT